MATEYKCDICGNPATVHITKIIDGKKITIHLCSACAEKASLEAINLPAEIFPKIQELEKQIADSHKAKLIFARHAAPRFRKSKMARVFHALTATGQWAGACSRYSRRCTGRPNMLANLPSITLRTQTLWISWTKPLKA